MGRAWLARVLVGLDDHGNWMVKEVGNLTLLAGERDRTAGPMKKLDVVVCGEVNAELILWNHPFPELEKEKLAERMLFTFGGSSAIFAYNLAALGAKVGFVTVLGKDALGDYLFKRLREQKIDLRHLRRSRNTPTGITVTMFMPPHKSMVTCTGTIAALRLRDIPFDYLRSARHLHVGCFFLQKNLQAGAATLFRRAKKLGLTTSLDTNWDPSEQWDSGLKAILPHVDIFLPNEDEALRITAERDLHRALDALAKIVPIVVVKRGEKGAVLGAGARVMEAPALPAKFLESTGAGDTFDAGFVFRFVGGAPLEECLRFANACGALAVTGLGGTTAFAARKNVKVFLERELRRHPPATERPREER